MGLPAYAPLDLFQAGAANDVLFRDSFIPCENIIQTHEFKREFVSGNSYVDSIPARRYLCVLFDVVAPIYMELERRNGSTGLDHINGILRKLKEMNLHTVDVIASVLLHDYWEDGEENYSRRYLDGRLETSGFNMGSGSSMQEYFDRKRDLTVRRDGENKVDHKGRIVREGYLSDIICAFGDLWHNTRDTDNLGSREKVELKRGQVNEIEEGIRRLRNDGLISKLGLLPGKHYRREILGELGLILMDLDFEIDFRKSNKLR